MVRRNTNKGFTLAELLIVVALMSVTVAVSVPVFSGVIDKANKDYEEAEKDSNDMIDEAIAARAITPVPAENVPAPPPKSEAVDTGGAGGSGGSPSSSSPATVGTPDGMMSDDSIPAGPTTYPSATPKLTPTVTAGTGESGGGGGSSSTGDITPSPTGTAKDPNEMVPVGNNEVTRAQYERDFPDPPTGASAIYLTEGKQGAYAYEYNDYLDPDTTLKRGVIYSSTTTVNGVTSTSYYLYIGNPGQDNSNDPYHKNGKDFPNYWYQIVTEYSNNASDTSKNRIHYTDQDFLKSAKPLENVKGGDMRIDPNGARYIFASYGVNPQNLWVGDGRWVRIDDSCVP